MLSNATLPPSLVLSLILAIHASDTRDTHGIT